MKTEQKPIHSGFGAQTTAEEAMAGADVKGKVVVITGGHSGIGLETTKVFLNGGATVIVGARDMKKAGENLAGLNNVTCYHLELAETKDVDAFAEKVLSITPKIDILINNAGVMYLPELEKNSKGYEMHFATNHLGHFRLTFKLWNALKQSGNARVISLSSRGHRVSGVHLEDPNFDHRPYKKTEAYGQSKSANALFAVALDNIGASYNIRAFAVHPGAILTDLTRHMTEEDFKPYGFTKENGKYKAPSDAGFKNPEQGAATTVWCAVSSSLNNKGGVYCEDCDIAEPVADDSQSLSGVRHWAVDVDIATKLWHLSENMLDMHWEN